MLNSYEFFVQYLYINLLANVPALFYTKVKTEIG
jgi:hypothetical protein